MGGVKLDTQLAAQIAETEGSHEKAHALREMFDANRMDRWKHYCSLITAVFEDIPMGARLALVFDASWRRRTHSQQPAFADGGRARSVAGTMNAYYLLQSTVECVDAAAEADPSKKICDLDATTTLILMLSNPRMST